MIIIQISKHSRTNQSWKKHSSWFTNWKWYEDVLERTHNSGSSSSKLSTSNLGQNRKIKRNWEENKNAEHYQFYYG